LRGVARQHGHHGLIEDVAVVELSGHAVHGGTGESAAHVDGALVGVQAGESGQQAGVDVDQPAFVVLNEPGREDAHEAGQHHQRRPVAVDFGHQRGIEGLSRCKPLVIQDRGGNVVLAGDAQAAHLGLVADDGRHAGAVPITPMTPLGGPDDGGHVRATA